jgi:lipopolysaccharide transport system ATP-binding protein
MSNAIISVEDLGKRYRITHQGERQRYIALRDVIMEKARNMFRSSKGGNRGLSSTREDFWALRNVSFDVKHGEVVGIIGRNGAGKSTLLKILSRITEPTEGRVWLRGRVASLLEVGTGFHPELTGRENIFLNGAILGMSKAEIKSKFDEIVAFAEVEKFLDTPVKRYSSGMYVRLAFAVAAHLEPEILIVDEVLAVGDAKFQKKCMGKMQDVARGGRTILFVSHNMGAIMALCSRAVWLDAGKCKMIGPAQDVGNTYLSSSAIETQRRLDLAAISRAGANGSQARIVAIEWLDGVPLQHGRPTRVKLEIAFTASVHDVRVGLGFSTMDGTRVGTYDSNANPTDLFSVGKPGIWAFELQIDTLPLNPGLYSIDVGCNSSEEHGLDYLKGAGSVEVISGPNTPAHYFGKESAVRLHGVWNMNPVNHEIPEQDVVDFKGHS